MKWIAYRLPIVAVVFAGATVAFWAGSSRAQGTAAGNRLRLGVASASKRWDPPDGLTVKNIPPQCLLSATLEAQRGGQVLVTGDATFRPATVEWVGIEVVLVQGATMVRAPVNNWSYAGGDGTYFMNLSFSTVLEIPRGGPWNVQLLAAALSPVVAHTAHVNAVYVGE